MPTTHRYLFYVIIDVDIHFKIPLLFLRLMVLQNVLKSYSVSVPSNEVNEDQKTGMSKLKQFSWATGILPSFNKVFSIFFAVSKGDAPSH